MNITNANIVSMQYPIHHTKYKIKGNINIVDVQLHADNPNIFIIIPMIENTGIIRRFGN